MKSYIKIMLSFGLLIVIAIVLYSFTTLFINNEFGEVFTFNDKLGKISSIENIDNKSIYVSYEFDIEEKQYQNKIRVYKELYYDVVADENVIILYNEMFPSVNYIKGLKLVSGNYFSLSVGIIMLLLLLFIVLYVDKEKWIEKYRVFYKKL